MDNTTRNLLTEIRDHLDLPSPATGADRPAAERLLDTRAGGVVAILDALLRDGDLSPEIVIGVLRDRAQQYPVTYQPYVEDTGRPGDVEVCGPACQSPAAGEHASCPGPRAGATVAVTG